MLFSPANFCIPTGSKRSKEAWDFLVWLQSSEVQILFSRTINNIPNVRDALRVPKLREGEELRQKFGSLMDLAARAQPCYMPSMPVTNLYMNELDRALDAVMFGERPASDALADVRVPKELYRQ